MNAATRPVPLTDPRAIDVLAMLDDRVLRAALAEFSGPAEPAVNIGLPVNAEPTVNAGRPSTRG